MAPPAEESNVVPEPSESEGPNSMDIDQPEVVLGDKDAALGNDYESVTPGHEFLRGYEDAALGGEASWGDEDALGEANNRHKPNNIDATEGVRASPMPTGTSSTASAQNPLRPPTLDELRLAKHHYYNNYREKSSRVTKAPRQDARCARARSRKSADRVGTFERPSQIYMKYAEHSIYDSLINHSPWGKHETR